MSESRHCPQCGALVPSDPDTPAVEDIQSGLTGPSAEAENDLDLPPVPLLAPGSNDDCFLEAPSVSRLAAAERVANPIEFGSSSSSRSISKILEEPGRGRVVGAFPLPELRCSPPVQAGTGSSLERRAGGRRRTGAGGRPRTSTEILVLGPSGQLRQRHHAGPGLDALEGSSPGQGRGKFPTPDSVRARHGSTGGALGQGRAPRADPGRAFRPDRPAAKGRIVGSHADRGQAGGRDARTLERLCQAREKSRRQEGHDPSTQAEEPLE